MAEVFGFPITNLTDEADRYREKRLCPFNNKVPNCTKDKAKDPLGVCSVFEDGGVTITCPVRFRENWLIADDAAAFFFPNGAKWTSLTEVRLKDKHGKSAGNIDVVLVSYDEKGKITDFGACEVQAVYISGNIRDVFQLYMQDPAKNTVLDWSTHENYPRPDYLSSSRKRLAPQLIYKGGILNSWKKKMAVAVHSSFFRTLPAMEETTQEKAEIAWLIYEMDLDTSNNRYALRRSATKFTAFDLALKRITSPEPGALAEFIDQLQSKLDEKLEPPETATLTEESLT